MAITADKLLTGDCLDILSRATENSIDSIVTDPPYGLSFMGKKWDYDVPSVEIWKQAYRVLKPGGYLLSFAGSRTYHRMAVNIEDAGFEIRDMIEWVYSTGFPKSLNVFKQLKKECTCGNMEAYENRTNKRQGSPSEAEHDLRPLSESHLSQEVHTRQEQGEVLQSGLSEQGTHNEGAEAVAVLQFPEGGEQPSVEGRSDIQKTERELQGSNLPEVSAGVFTNGEERRIHNATQISNGSASKQATDENRGSASHRPQSEQQPDREPCAFCQQYFAQATRTLGVGTALKPSHEPIVMARKPLIGTVVENVMAYGTGGINIDGCRVESNEELGRNNNARISGTSYVVQKETMRIDNSGGKRFPANLIHDGSDEVVGLFPISNGGAFPKKSNIPTGVHYEGGWGNVDNGKRTEMGNGSAARFFYCAKASKSERNAGLEALEIKEAPVNDFRPTLRSNPENWKTLIQDTPYGGANRSGATQNNHPTVKPVALMQYLVRLVTPPNGTVLDPFMGSGTTGIAAKREGFSFIGIEREPEYVEIAKARLEAA